MAVVDTERHGQILVEQMGRPRRLDSLRQGNDLDVAGSTGVGRAFRAGLPALDRPAQ
jgi:hypothetical protein